MTMNRNIYVDTETTGFDSVNNKTIELAFIEEENGNILNKYDNFINICEPLPDKIKELTGISDMMLHTFGLSEKAVADDFKAVLGDGNVTVYAHNAQFDLGFIYNLLIRNYDKSEIDALFAKIKWIDSLTILRDRKAFPHKLSDGIEYYNIEGVKNSHRAIDDTEAMYYLVQAMRLERDDIEDYTNIFGYFAKHGVNGERFPFITYIVHPYNNVGLKDSKDILPTLA